MNNPFAQAKFRSTQVATELKRKGSNERVVANNGEFNASSKADLIQTIASLLQASQNGAIVTETAAVQAEQKAKQHKDMLTAAFKDKAAYQSLGAAIAEELQITQNREGFMRKFLARQEITQGQFPQARMRMKNTVAVIATSPSKLEVQHVRDNFYYPPEFYVEANPFIEQRDISRANGDMVEEKYMEALEAFMVGEDRQYLAMAKRTINIANAFTTVVGTLNPLALGAFRNSVAQWGIPAEHWLIANDLWTDIAGDEGFQRLIDPVGRHELVLEGTLGTVMGMKVTSDGFRHPEHRVLAKGEMFVIGSANMHGQYTDRGGIESSPLDPSVLQRPGRGWYMFELLSMIISNPRSVACGKRT